MVVSHMFLFSLVFGKMNLFDKYFHSSVSELGNLAQMVPAWPGEGGTFWCFRHPKQVMKDP